MIATAAIDGDGNVVQDSQDQQIIFSSFNFNLFPPARIVDLRVFVKALHIALKDSQQPVHNGDDRVGSKYFSEEAMILPCANSSVTPSVKDDDVSFSR